MPTTVVSIGPGYGELLALRWRDLDLDGAALHITRPARRFSGRGVVYLEPKTNRSRRPVALSRETVHVPLEHRRWQAEQLLALGPAYCDSGLVFASPTGQPIDDSNLRRAS